MSNLVILTGSFPYNGGEQFLETEIFFWANTQFNKIYIIPSKNTGKLRSIPENIEVLNRKPAKGKLRYAILAMLHPTLYKELLYLFKHSEILNLPWYIKEAVISTALVLKDSNELNKTLKQISQDKIIIYSYWNDISSYAACLLKSKGIVKGIFSRSHRFDLYEEERPNNYMPLKRQFANNYDKVYLLTDNAIHYYHNKYSANIENLEIARLGVTVPTTPKNNISFRDKINIISLSNCIPVKQIDLIMNAVQTYSRENPDISVQWCHIGGGPLYRVLKDKSKKTERSVKNLKINFLGELTNSEVKNHLRDNNYNMIINASKSEGVPVSIMEAMSYCIPAIAPNVGGISDLVNTDNGYLMPSNCTPLDIINGIDYIRDNQQNLGINAYHWVYKNFNCDRNYPKFINRLQSSVTKNET